MKKKIKRLVEKMLRERLLQEVSVAKLKHPFKAILLTGPAGAGKSFAAKHLLKIPAQARQYSLNPDDIIEDLFPKFGVSLKFVHDSDDPVAAQQAAMRKIAKVGTMSKGAGYINKAKPILIDTTGHEPERITPVLDSLVDIGYDVGIIKVFVPKETSIKRDINRPRTVGAPLTPKIWDDYKKNVVDGKQYDTYAAGNKNVTMLNSEPFWNVYNLGTKDAVETDAEGNKKLLAKAREKVLDVEGDIPVSIAEMDRVRGDMEKSVKDFFTPKEVNNPRGSSLYHGLVALSGLTGGKFGQEVTSLYDFGLDYPEEAQEDSAVMGAINTLGEITGEPDLEKSFKEYVEFVKKASRAPQVDVIEPKDDEECPSGYKEVEEDGKRLCIQGDIEAPLAGDIATRIRESEEIKEKMVTEVLKRVRKYTRLF